MKKLLSILIFLGILFSFCSCGNGLKNTASNSKEDSKQPMNSQKAETYSFQGAKVIQSQLASQGQAVILANFTYQVKDVSASKKLIGCQKDDVEYFKITADDSGNLISAHSYVYIDFAIKNMLAKEATNCLNGLRIISITSNNEVRPWAELNFVDKSQHENSKNYGIYKFKPNEETIFRLGFIIPDEGLKENLHLEINPTGASGSYRDPKQYNPDVKRFIKLKIY